MVTTKMEAFRNRGGGDHAASHDMEDRRFTESISGHLPPDAASQARVRVVRSRLEQIADID